MVYGPLPYYSLLTQCRMCTESDMFKMKDIEGDGDSSADEEADLLRMHEEFLRAKEQE